MILMFKDYFILNCIGGDIYPITSVINHGYPTNSVHLRGWSKSSDHVQNQNQNQ